MSPSPGVRAAHAEKVEASGRVQIKIEASGDCGPRARVAGTGGQGRLQAQVQVQMQEGVGPVGRIESSPSRAGWVGRSGLPNGWDGWAPRCLRQAGWPSSAPACLPACLPASYGTLLRHMPSYVCRAGEKPAPTDSTTSHSRRRLGADRGTGVWAGLSGILWPNQGSGNSLGATEHGVEAIRPFWRAFLFLF